MSRVLSAMNGSLKDISMRFVIITGHIDNVCDHHRGVPCILGGPGWFVEDPRRCCRRKQGIFGGTKNRTSLRLGL
jgi:hypothetical protein